ncbi:MAG: glycoside hydrolase family 36 protein [Bacteroidota bacterium]
MNKKLIIPILIFFSCLLAVWARADVISQIRASKALVRLSNGLESKDLNISRQWKGNKCTTVLTNNGTSMVSVKEVELFTLSRLFTGETPFYGEGFQMLSQSGGTLADPVDIGPYTDRNHYKLEEPKGYRVVYNVLSLSPKPNDHYLLGFSSATRFIGKFYLSADTIKVVMDLEGLEIQAGASVKLEEFYVEQGQDKNLLFDHFAIAIQQHHVPLKSAFPTGWCSWYAFKENVTTGKIYENLSAIKKEVPKLKYVQVDDGYQANMGDWLTIGKSFGGGIKEVLKKIKDEGFEPAIWVAPFICDTNSTIFKNHKDWLLKDESGALLRSDQVGFGGWRLAPWYVLDGTHPQVQKHLEELFRTMREEWGCTYFKLDANYWGAIHKAKYYKKGATRTEAYREGMKAILKGTGDAFVLGCNHPMWPSLGLIQGSRSSGDIDNSWKIFKDTGRENLSRSWQNGKLWWNDPDCLLLTGEMTDNQFMFHAALLYASGGMLLSGDDLPAIPARRIPILKKLALEANGETAAFNSDGFDYGWIGQGNTRKLVVLNWDKEARGFVIPISKPCKVVDFFTGQVMGSFKKEILLKDFAAENGGVYLVTEEI